MNGSDLHLVRSIALSIFSASCLINDLLSLSSGHVYPKIQVRFVQHIVIGRKKGVYNFKIDFDLWSVASWRCIVKYFEIHKKIRMLKMVFHLWKPDIILRRFFNTKTNQRRKFSSSQHVVISRWCQSRRVICTTVEKVFASVTFIVRESYNCEANRIKRT